MFTAFAFPEAASVALTFWTLYVIDRELVSPVAYEAFSPAWLSHILHTNVIVLITIELFIVPHRYLGWRKEASAVAAYMIVYICWVNIVKMVTGFWVYAVLDKLGIYETLAFYLGNIALPVVFYFIGQFMSRHFWRKEPGRTRGSQEEISLEPSIVR